MKTLALIVLVAAATWFVSTQFDINWPRILIVQQTLNETPSQESPKRGGDAPLSPAQAPPELSIEEIEVKVLKCANEVRVTRDTAELIWDDQLHEIAKAHSQEMANSGKLFHSSEDCPYAENCWRGIDGRYFQPEDIIETWMQSEFHRTWILCPTIRHIGIGLVETENGSLYATWTFWRDETKFADWWYCLETDPPDWWH